MTGFRVPQFPQDWIFIGIIFLLFAWLMGFVALVFHVAEEKGRSGVAWGCAALLFTPVIALIALAAVPDKLGPSSVTGEPPEVDEIPEFKWRRE